LIPPFFGLISQVPEYIRVPIDQLRRLLGLACDLGVGGDELLAGTAVVFTLFLVVIRA
jgi:hypothetical protein